MRAFKTKFRFTKNEIQKLHQQETLVDLGYTSDALKLMQLTRVHGQLVPIECDDFGNERGSLYFQDGEKEEFEIDFRKFSNTFLASKDVWSRGGSSVNYDLVNGKGGRWKIKRSGQE